MSSTRETRIEPGAPSSVDDRRWSARAGAPRAEMTAAITSAAELRRVMTSLREAIAGAEVGRALRDALRIAELAPTDDPAFGGFSGAFALLAHESVVRAPWGFDHGAAMVSVVSAWVASGWVPREEAFAAAVLCASEPYRGLAPRPVAMACVGDRGDPTRVAADLRAGRRAEAETRVRALAFARGAEATARAALLPFVAADLLDYGHGAIFLARGLELAARFPESAAEVLGAVTVELAWASSETAQPSMVHTRAALDAVGSLPAIGASRLDGAARDALERAVLAGEASAARAARDALAAGVAPEALLRAVGHAAAVRVGRFDPAWALRPDVDAGWLDVTHAVTFAEAALALAPRALPHDIARLAVQAAGFVGRLARADRAGERAQGRGAGVVPGALEDALDARDEAAARAWAGALREPPARRSAFARLAPFALLDAAVLPVHIAHAVKTTEALRRLDAADPLEDGVYLDAALAFLLGAKRERHLRRLAAVTREYVRSGRAPSGLY